MVHEHIISIIFLCFLFFDWVWNHDSKCEKEKKNIFKFDTVHSNTTIIIYKYGMKIDVIKELKMRSIDLL